MGISKGFLFLFAVTLIFMKILMVCLGNICRSPVAEGVLRHKLIQHNLTTVEIDSAGTASYHIGEPPDSRAIRHARSKGIDISGLRGRQFSKSDFDRFHRIFAMDPSNYKDILSLARHEEDKKKVDLILNLLYPGQNSPVPDPYYGGEEGFEEVYNLLDKACDRIIEDILMNKG